MSNGLKIFLAFGLGAVTGGAVAYHILKERFDNDLFEEVKKVKESLHLVNVPEEPLNLEKVEIESEKNPPVEVYETKSSYDTTIRDIMTDYQNYSKKYKSKPKGRDKSNMDKPTKKDMLDLYENLAEEDEHIEADDAIYYEEEDIFPTEKNPVPYSVDPQGKVASYSSYDKISLIFYAQSNILAFEDSNEEFVNPEDSIGLNWREAIGEYEEDIAYIRNDNTETDYEIVRENQRYSYE